MGYKSSLALFIYLSCFLNSIFADWIQKGKVIKILSGDTFIHYDYQTKKKQKYKLVCVKAESPRTKKGKYQKKILSQKIDGKEIDGIIRGYLDNGTILIDAFDIEKTKENSDYTSLAYTLAVYSNVLKKVKEYPLCWPEDNK